ncbi:MULTISPECIES: flagellar hook-basal body complex protein FliE [Clostridia]|uniref:flagellar hook-basal body complex protein FliE n=1 Tax=Clostridia TaxID=186801 RepID=UPI000EA09BBC|nr:MULTISPECIES: flagellar hook-basal body complex protein FliE [Clostridia]NBJ68407.1 flagellar hook-basal body complex protein FliE [Roseburia sp. 1XD42-34]RKI81495.1 flagellar hook-basal body complex protein FliE [Clostridium sp. 1xD42-85]
MIQAINQPLQPLSPTTDAQNKATISPGEAQGKFASALKNAIDKVNEVQIASDKKTEAMANGQVTNLHDVMIASQKSNIALEATVQIQSKVVEAYKEVMSMQV